MKLIGVKFEVAATVVILSAMPSGSLNVVMAQKYKNNPEFAKKKVTFKQYSIIAKQWNEILSAEEAQYRKIKDEELENKETFAKDIEAGWDKARAKILDKGKVVAKEVPVTDAYPPPTAGAVMSTPGAARSGFR